MVARDHHDAYPGRPRGSCAPTQSLVVHLPDGYTKSLENFFFIFTHADERTDSEVCILLEKCVLMLSDDHMQIRYIQFVRRMEKRHIYVNLNTDDSVSLRNKINAMIQAAHNPITPDGSKQNRQYLKLEAGQNKLNFECQEWTKKQIENLKTNHIQIQEQKAIIVAFQKSTNARVQEASENDSRWRIFDGGWCYGQPYRPMGWCDMVIRVSRKWNERRCLRTHGLP